MVLKRKRPRSVYLGGVALIQQAALFGLAGRGAFSFVPSHGKNDFARPPHAAGTILQQELVVLQSAFLDEPLLVVLEEETKYRRRDDDDEDDDEGAELERRGYRLSLTSLVGTEFVSELQQNQFHVAQFHENLRWIEHRLASKSCGYSWNDVQQVVKAIYASVGNNLGDIDLLLRLTGLVKLLLESYDSTESSTYCSIEIMLGCIWHFSESNEAHRHGLLDSDFVLQNVLLRHDHAQKHHVLSPSGESAAIKVVQRNAQIVSVVGTMGGHSLSRFAPSDSHVMYGAMDPEQMLVTSSISTMALDTTSTVSSEDVHFGAWAIARSAAKMKRVEVLSRAMGSAALSHRDADHIRCLLLTVDDFDWRALLVRCVSNLYEIKAIQKRTAQTVRTAREGLLVYGPLASMLGLAELKAKIEDHAFRFLYPRQHKTVDSIFGSAEGSIEAASSFLATYVQALLRSDEFLQEQAEVLLVSSRVKERYSFWKKLIRKRAELLGQLAVQKLGANRTQQRRWNIGLIDQVPDTVALRVVLRSKKSGLEPPEATQAKEKLLCYYVQEKIRAKWPVWDSRRTKDYIQSPKGNSYQSLHYTSSIVLGNDDLPFEVQVRSYDMHLAAEYGSASHSIYKMQTPGNATASLLCSSAAPQSSASSMTCGYLESLEVFRAAVVDKNTFVFVSIPQNKTNFIMSIPPNCRVQDAIAVLPVALSSSESSVFVNGRKPRLDDRIQNGDALLVLETDDAAVRAAGEV